MTKRIVFQIVAALVVITLIGGLFWYAGFQDWLGEDEIARGVRHLTYELDGPYRVSMLEVDRKRAEAEILAWRSGGLTATTAQIRHAATFGYTTIGAINADFFSFESTLPIGNQITNGEWVSGGASQRSHVIISKDGNVYYDAVRFSGTFSHPAVGSATINTVNRPANRNQTVYFNRYNETALPTPSTSVMYIGLEPISNYSNIKPGLERLYLVSQINPDAPEISGKSAALVVRNENISTSAYTNISVRDTVRVMLGLQGTDIDFSGKHVWQVIGGGGRILRDGLDATDENQERERINSAFLQNRHPRTFVASDKEGRRVWLGTVDGRQTGSIGMSFPEMSDFLLGIGAYNAVNLDGGGSTTLVVGDSVANRPSDANGERPVANILLVTGKQ